MFDVLCSSRASSRFHLLSSPRLALPPLRSHPLPSRSQSHLAPDQPPLDARSHRNHPLNAASCLGRLSCITPHASRISIFCFLLFRFPISDLVLPRRCALAFRTGECSYPVVDTPQRLDDSPVTWCIWSSSDSTRQCHRDSHREGRHRRRVQWHPLFPGYADDFAVPRRTLPAHGSPPGLACGSGLWPGFCVQRGPHAALCFGWVGLKG